MVTSSRRKPKADPEMESRVASLEARVAKLEKGVPGKRTRRKRDYTDEEREAIRARLLAGQEAAAKKRRAAEEAPQNRA